MNKERLSNVIRALKETPHAERFDMQAYAHPCGTPACAFGNYAARTDLQDAVKLETWKHLDGSFGGVVIVGARTGHYVGLSDIAEHFGLTDDEEEQLFGPDGCGGAKTTEQAIQYIEWFMSKPEFENE